MRIQIRLLLICGLTFCATAAAAQEKFPNPHSCALDFWENVKAAEDLTLEVPVIKLQAENGETIAKLIKEKGLASAYLTILKAYMHCIEETGIDIDRPGPAGNDPYWGCAMQSATRVTILVRIAKGETETQLKAAMPADFHDTINLLYQDTDKSFLKAVAGAAQAGKRCVENVPTKPE